MNRSRTSVMGDFNINAFDALHMSPPEILGLILEHGTEVELRRAWVCPCSRIETGRGAANCTVCRGLGYAYPAERRCRTTYLVSRRDNQLSATKAGKNGKGSMRVTLLPGVEVADGDLILPDCDTHTVHEHFVRSVVQVDNRTIFRAYDVPPRANKVRAERLLYPGPISVDGVFWIKDSSLVEAKQDQDVFLIEDDGGLRIEWRGVGGPSPGEGYSVRYRAPAAYMVRMERGSVRQEGGASLPQQVTVQRLDKVQESDLR